MKKINYPETFDVGDSPFGFREPNREIEGYLDNPWDIINIFEPIDVLEGAVELVDNHGTIFIVKTYDLSRMKDNEYGDKDKLYLLEVKP